MGRESRLRAGGGRLRRWGRNCRDTPRLPLVVTQGTAPQTQPSGGQYLQKEWGGAGEVIQTMPNRKPRAKCSEGERPENQSAIPQLTLHIWAHTAAKTLKEEHPHVNTCVQDHSWRRRQLSNQGYGIRSCSQQFSSSLSFSFCFCPQ